MDHDCLIIGGGPAGLTAAIYLARYHLALRVVDAGRSRAGWIPRTHNHAGFPGGISGKDLLARMREQAQLYGAAILTGRVTRLDRVDGGFCAETGGGTITARSVLLATGITNRRPQVDDALHDEALAAGLIRYCPVCDGFEVTDRRVGVIGTGARGVAEAGFLRGFTADLTLIASDGPHRLDDDERARLDQLGIACIDGPARVAAIRDGRLVVETAQGEQAFDSVYPALGSDVHAELAGQIGVALSEDGNILVDDHQRTNVAGVYAAGDVVIGLDQISHAMGEGGVAATTIRNDLCRDRPILRETCKAATPD
jgi:thioredoxin reductase (NADPH)